MKFFIIDTSKLFSKSVASYFRKKDVMVDIENDYGAILDNLKHTNLHRYDAYILSISEDDKRGLDLLEYMQLIGVTRPVIFISYAKSINLLSSVFARGAEDYINFPFDLKELELRVMKSVRKLIAEDEIELPNDFSYTYTENSIAHTNIGIDLTKKQRELIYLLMTNKNSLVSYEMIQEYVYANKTFTNNAISTHIRDIKKKIKGIPIKAVKGEGYILRL